MFLRSTNRKKDGKDHRYFSIVENRRVPGGENGGKLLNRSLNEDPRLAKLADRIILSILLAKHEP
jgi:hypothetical protein